jgi:hypothetical protein
MRIAVVPLLAGLLLFALALGAQQQPIPYSHKTHMAVGLQCNSCHRNPDPGEVMGFPGEALCMGCHRAVKSDSPHIQKLAAAAKEKTPLPWVRVYELPEYVYFSHRVHTQAGGTCESCHGPVAERAVITKEVAHTMETCMACHAANNAPNECDTCHAAK